MPHSSLSAISSLMLLEDLTLCNLHVVETVSSFTSAFHPRPITNLPASLTRLRIAARETDVDSLHIRSNYVSQTLRHLTRVHATEDTGAD
jgi:hypothetical protein